MNKSANHHYVPKFILREFCFSASTVYYYSRNSKYGAIEERNIGSIFKKRHLNAYRDSGGKRNDDLETFFGKHCDDTMAKVLSHVKKCFREKKVPSLNHIQKRDIFQFMFNHIKRTPEFHDKIVGEDRLVDQVLEIKDDFELINGPMSSEQQRWLKSYVDDKVFVEQARNYVLRQQNIEILNTLAKKTIVFAGPESPQKQFVVSSNPVIRLYNKKNARLDSEFLELWTTFSPQIALGLVAPNFHTNSVFIDSKEVRKLNVGLIEQSHAFVSKCPSLAKSFVESKEVDTSAKNF